MIALVTKRCSAFAGAGDPYATGAVLVAGPQLVALVVR